jgi:L-alanine-DL-glutamate epimerase-like enolase superfamily enzyme
VRALLDRIPENQAAKTLIDNACWDLHAACHGQALWRRWGGSGRVELSVGAHAAGAARNGCRGGRHGGPVTGFRTLKVKGGQASRSTSPACERSALPWGTRFASYVDANGAYSADQAADYSRAMADAGAVMDRGSLRARSRRRAPKAATGMSGTGCSSTSAAPRCAMPGLFIAQEARALSIKPGRVRPLDRARHGRACAPVRLCVCGRPHGRKRARDFAALQFAAALPDPALPAELSWFLADDRAGHHHDAGDRRRRRRASRCCVTRITGRLGAMQRLAG